MNMTETGEVVKRLEDFIQGYAEQNGYSRVVVGLSGGVDSSVAAALTARALGSKNVLGLILPYRHSSASSVVDARNLAEFLEIQTEEICVTPMMYAYFGCDMNVTQIRLGNKIARERMSILFDIASRDRRLVLGTSNKTEICLGYATWYGDSACSFNPLGGLYKRDVRAVARYLCIPEKIVNKKPTADLWPGQTDEGELGIDYDTADAILFEIVENGVHDVTEIMSRTGAFEEDIRYIVSRLNRYRFKRSLPATDLLDGNPIPDKVILGDVLR